MITKSATRRRRNVLRLMAHATAIGAVASLAAASMTLASPVAAAAVTTTSQPDVNAATLASSQQSIIMSDGRICNPRWGC